MPMVAMRTMTSQLQWVVNAFLLPLSALLLFGGALGDRLPCPAERGQIGRGKARLDRVELDVGHCFGVLNCEH